MFSGVRDAYRVFHDDDVFDGDVDHMTAGVHKYKIVKKRQLVIGQCIFCCCHLDIERITTCFAVSFVRETY